MSDNFKNYIKKFNQELTISDKGTNKYRIIKDFSGTYIQKQIEREENMLDPIFRVFQPAKPSSNRKLNVNIYDNFNPFSDSLMDYASIIAYKMEKSWHEFNRLISFQIPFCPNNCWHCFLPKELYIYNPKSKRRYKECSVKEIIDSFIKQKKYDKKFGKESNVLRITGGEPFTLPQLILDCLEELETRNLNDEIFIWTETNLQPFIKGKDGKSFMDIKENKNILKKLAKYNNFLIHPCFHGLDEDEYLKITDNQINRNVSLEEQVEAVKSIVDSGIDVYPTFGSNVCNPKNIPILFDLFNTKKYRHILYKIALIEYDLRYEPLTRSGIKKRDFGYYPKYANIRIWNQLLVNNFGTGYGILPRHFNFKNLIREHKNDQKDKKSKVPKYTKPALHLFKNSSRDLYHQEILNLISLPIDTLYKIEYDKEKWIPRNLHKHFELNPDYYKDMEGYLIYVTSFEREGYKFLPVRKVLIKKIRIRENIAVILFELKDLLNFSVDNGTAYDEFTKIINKYFNKELLPGNFYVQYGEALLNENGNALSSAFNDNDKISLSNNYNPFQSIVKKLISDKKMSKSIFFNISFPDNKLSKKINNNPTISDSSYYEIKEGEIFKIHLENYLPNMSYFDNLEDKYRTIRCLISNETISLLNHERIIVPKYNTTDFIFKANKVNNDSEVTLTFYNEIQPFRAPKVEIKVVVKSKDCKKKL